MVLRTDPRRTTCGGEEADPERAPNSNSTQAAGWIYFRWDDPSLPVQSTGNYYSGNQNSAGTGCLAAFVPPGGSFPTSFTANLPVGVPFRMLFALSSSGGTYAFPEDAPATVVANLSGRIGDENGHVVDLPPGYSMNSVQWGVVDGELMPTTTAAPEPQRTSWGELKASYRE